MLNKKCKSFRHFKLFCWSSTKFRTNFNDFIQPFFESSNLWFTKNPTIFPTQQIVI